ncbi:MAG TPA: hypothetical protein ENN80_07625 [Candidatus Hydrogenedentes bacterium]|nr:hypothetical protein [Candidatus Hydrogenedentota bacterium]
MAVEKGDAYRLLALGDSFTYGWGVNIEATWVKQLESNLRAGGLEVEVINAGAPGAGPEDYANTAARVIPILEPDMVIVGMLHDDFTSAGPPGIEERVHKLLAAVRKVYPNLTRLLRHERPAWESVTPGEEGGEPKRKSADENRALDANAARVNLEQVNAAGKARFERIDDEVKSAFLEGNLNPFLVIMALNCPDHYLLRLDLDSPFVQTCIEQTAGHLGRLNAMARRHDAHALVVSIPLGPYVNENSYRNIQRVGFEADERMLATDVPDRATQIASEQAGLSFYAVTDGFRARRDDAGLFFELDGHFTPAGHELYAELITPAIADAIASDAVK